jgi:hypothetical protein
MALVDNSLLVYAADNTLSHFLVVPTDDSVTLRLCGSMSFDGVIAHPSAVRALSWMIPSAQKRSSFRLTAVAGWRSAPRRTDSARRARRPG